MRIITLVFFSCIFFTASNTLEAQSDWIKKAEVNYAKAENLNTDFTQQEKQFINDVYGSKAKDLVYNNADFLKSIKHLLRNRISITKVDSNSKSKKGKLLSQVPFSNDFINQNKEDFTTIENFNPLKYRMEFFSKGTYMYIIDNTDYVIQITSQFRK